MCIGRSAAAPVGCEVAPRERRARSVKTAAGVFLAGAASRLLPVSIPFRFFGAAIGYHLLAWLALLAGAPGVPRFAGGLGWPLAGLHLVTLGVLVMTAIGASLQLLPVATRQPLRRIGWAAVIWWLYAPGVGAVALGMGAVIPWLLGVGAFAVAFAMLVWAVLLANNLRGARGMPGVVVHGWASLGSLLVVLGSALSLTLAYTGAPLLDRTSALAVHIAFALYGFMGALALGLSYILVPMFALAPAPSERQAVASCALAIAALALILLAAFGVAPQTLRIVAVLLGMAALVLHLRQMLGALRTGLRRELGRSFALVRVAWTALAASLGAALALQLGARWDGLAIAVRAAGDRRLAAHLCARHAAAHLAVSRIDARGAGPQAPGNAVAAECGCAARAALRVSSRGTRRSGARRRG